MLFFSQRVAYSCSAEGSIMVWDVSTLQVRTQPRLLQRQLHAGLNVWQAIKSFNVTGWFFQCFHFCVQPLRWEGSFASPATACSPSPAVTELFGAVSFGFSLLCVKTGLAGESGCWKWTHLCLFLFRRQGQYNGGVEERLSQTSPDSAGATQRIGNYVQLCAAVTRGTPTPPPDLILVSLPILDCISSFFFLLVSEGRAVEFLCGLRGNLYLAH